MMVVMIFLMAASVAGVAGYILWPQIAWLLLAFASLCIAIGGGLQAATRCGVKRVKRCGVKRVKRWI